MKRVLILLFTAASATATMAQSSKVVSAYNSMKAGEFDKAVEYIEPATEHEKTSMQEKTWRYRGQIYQGIAVSTEDFGIDKGTAALTALESYQKAIELDTKGRWEKENKLGAAQSQNLIINMGIQAYNDQDYPKAQKLFMAGANAAEGMGYVDTLAVYNTALSAEQAEDYDTAITYYKKSIEVDYLGPKMYLYLANLYQRQEMNDEYLAVVQEGRVKYPEDADLIVYELNYYLRNDKFEEAENNLKLAIEKEPNNKQLHFSLGVVYDNLGRTEEAAAAYQKAIDIDADYFDAVYNLGALYFNKGVEMNDAANSIEDNAKYAAAREEAKQVFIKSQPYLERAHEIDPTDMSAMGSLKQLYGLLGENDKYLEIKKKMEGAN